MNSGFTPRGHRKLGIQNEPRVAARVLLTPLVAALALAYPQPLLADKTEKQYRQAAETLRRGDPETAEREFEEILRAKPKYAEARILLA